MSEAKHTPGPWTVDTTSAFGAYGVWTDYPTHPGHDGAGYGSQICDMFTVSFKKTDAATRHERDANARLIAAAPDLLAACEAAEVVMDTAAMHGVGDLLPAAYRDSWAKAHTALRAALAKAAG